MKKTFLIALLLLSAGSLTRLFASPVGDTDSLPVTTIVVNLSTDVLLVNGPANVAATGSDAFLKNLTYARRGDTLVIGSLKSRDFTGKGILYVPVEGIREIRMNNAGTLKTPSALLVPELTVTVNGACNVAVSSLGKLNFRDTEGYRFEHSIDVRPARLGLYPGESLTRVAH